MEKISIIVPVYNCAPFLNRCVDSILRQTYNSIELLLIDDGSTDTSGTICDEYAVKDPRVRVIHQANAGVSAARNAGLEIAAGAFIGFVDADDWVDPAMFESLLQQAESTGAEIVMCDAVAVWDNGRIEPDTIPLLENDCTVTQQDWTPELLRWMAGSAWRCLYRANIVSDIRFPRGIKFSEDRLFNLYAMGCCNSLRYLKMPLYYRLMHAESAVHRYHEDHFEAGKAAHCAIRQALLSEWDGNAGYLQVYNRQFIGSAMGAICNYFYKTSPLTFAQKWRKVRTLCRDEYLQEVLSETEGIGLRGKSMKHKLVPMLCVQAWLTNKKHGR